MKAGRAIMRAGFLASVSGLATLAGCATVTKPPYTICDDTKPGADCPNDTAPVIVNNSI